MKTENATGDASRLYQAILPHLQGALWNDVRNAHTLAWMITGMLLSRRSTPSFWLPHVHSRAAFAQSSERRFQRWLRNKHLHPSLLYGEVITRALREWGQDTLVLALDTSVFCPPPGGIGRTTGQRGVMSNEIGKMEWYAANSLFPTH